MHCCMTGVVNLLLIVCQLKVSNHSVCQQHTHFYTSKGQYTFCVNLNKIGAAPGHWKLLGMACMLLLADPCCMLYWLCEPSFCLKKQYTYMSMYTSQLCLFLLTLFSSIYIKNSFWQQSFGDLLHVSIFVFDLQRSVLEFVMWNFQIMLQLQGMLWLHGNKEIHVCFLRISRIFIWLQMVSYSHGKLALMVITSSYQLFRFLLFIFNQGFFKVL